MLTYNKLIHCSPEEYHEHLEAIVVRWNVAVDLGEYLDIPTDIAYVMLEREQERAAYVGATDEDESV